MVQGYFEVAGGGAAEQACEAPNAVGIMQVNVKAQSDWGKNQMTALQNQTFVKHVGEDVPCRFGDITNLVATESKSMLANKQVTVSLSQTELLAALQIRKCYIKEDDHTSASAYKSDADTSDSTEESESDSDTTVESDGKDMVNVSYQDAAPQENSPNTSDISISESDISVASDENDVEVLSASTLRTRIDNLFKKDNTLKAKLGHAEASWKLIAVSGSAPSVFDSKCFCLARHLGSVMTSLPISFLFVLLTVIAPHFFKYTECPGWNPNGCIGAAGARTSRHSN